MGMIKFDVPHTLGREDAKKRVEQLFSYWSRKHGIQSKWAGDTATILGKAMGVQIQATLNIAEGAVHGEATDPGMLLRGTARKYLEKKFASFLDPKKSAADLENDPD